MQGSVRKKGDKWYYSIELPPTETITEDGKIKKKRNRIERAGGKTKKAALEAMNEAIHKYKNGYIEPVDITYNTYVTKYFEEFIKEKRKNNTYQRYKELYEHHVKEHIGNIKLKDLNDTHIERLLNAASKQRYNDKLLSQTTLQAIYSLINSTLNKAVSKKFIGANPCRFVDRPVREKFKAETLSEDEIALILSSFDMEDYSQYVFRLVFLTVLELGLRRGEVAGLQWGDIDFENGIVTIQHNYVYSNSAVYMETIKNELIGKLTVSDDLLEELEALRTLQKKHKLKYGEMYEKNIEDGKEMDFVFTWQNGKAIHPNYYTLKFNRLMKSLGIKKRVRLHDVRHTNATLLLKLRIDYKVLQARMRHTDVRTTLNIYAHVTTDMQRDATSAISNLIKKVK